MTRDIALAAKASGHGGSKRRRPKTEPVEKVGPRSSSVMNGCRFDAPEQSDGPQGLASPCSRMTAGGEHSRTSASPASLSCNKQLGRSCTLPSRRPSLGRRSKWISHMNSN